MSNLDDRRTGSEVRRCAQRLSAVTLPMAGRLVLPAAFVGVAQAGDEDDPAFMRGRVLLNHSPSGHPTNSNLS